MPQSRSKKPIGLKDLRVTRGGSTNVKGGASKKTLSGTQKSGGTSTPTPTPTPAPTPSPS